MVDLLCWTLLVYQLSVSGVIGNSDVLIMFIEATARAAKLGHQQVLWLFGPNHELTEVGAMNIFVVYINEQGGNNNKQYIIPLFNCKI